jgi:hypothetical protein
MLAKNLPKTIRNGVVFIKSHDVLLIITAMMMQSDREWDSNPSCMDVDSSVTIEIID